MYYIPHNQRGGHLLIIRASALKVSALSEARRVALELCALVRVG